MAKIIFFSIPFGSPYLIHEDIDIAADYHSEILHYVETRVLGFKADELIVGVQSKGQKERKVTFHIGADRLGVSCNCPFPGNVLCAHGYHAFQDLCGHDTSFFSIFAPGNLVSIALGTKDLFVTQHAKPKAFIIPAQSLGHLYGFKETEMHGLEASSGLKAVPVAVRDTEHVWMLVFSFFQSQRFLPMLVPVQGTLDKAGKSIKRFGRGFANINMDDGSYAGGKRELFTIAKKMYLPDSQKYYFHSEDLWAGKKEITVRFQQWNRALPMLSAQPFMYKFRIAHNRFFYENQSRDEILAKDYYFRRAASNTIYFKRQGEVLPAFYAIHGEGYSYQVTCGRCFVFCLRRCAIFSAGIHEGCGNVSLDE